MSVSLIDGTAFVIKKEQQIERSGALCFFLDGHIEDALLVYNAVGEYYGMITYRSLLESYSMAEAVIYEKLILDV